MSDAKRLKTATTMEVREAGTSGFKISTLGFGCWQLGQKGTDDYWGLEYTQEMANKMVKMASDAGVTYFDTAEDYAAGDSELQLGAAVKTLDADTQKKLVIGSKVLPNHCDDIRKYCEGTLKRLGRDSIDLYMVHWPIDKNSMAHFAGHATNAAGGRDYAVVGNDDEVGDAPPTETAFKTLMQLQKEGKVKHIGVSNFGVNQLKEALATGVKIAVNQLCYNMIFRAIEFDIVPFCNEQKIGVIAYSPLMQGILTGNYKTADEVPTYRARSRHFDGKRPKSRHGEGGQEKLLFEAIDKIRVISAESGIAMSDLAVAWPLHTPGVITVIAGITKDHHVAKNVAAAAIKIPADVLQKLNDATDALKQAMGSNADLWQGADGRIN